MKILAFAASNSRNSINRRLVKVATDMIVRDLEPTAEIIDLDLNDYEMPIFSVDREAEGGVPEEAYRFEKEIGAADRVIISFAEHNGSYAVAFKNVFDWTSRIAMKLYQNKPMLLMSTSPGGRGGAGVLAAASASVPRFGGDVRAVFSLPNYGETLDQSAPVVTDADRQAELRDALKALLA